MKLATLVWFITTAFCHSENAWIAPCSTDRRSPCPMVNSLANHGFLARDGRNISVADLVAGFEKGVNLAAAVTITVSQGVLNVSTTGSDTTFNLNDLSVHDFIEHDGSLSRQDFFFGDNHSFNATIWESVAAAFTHDTINLKTAISARAKRLAAAAAVNPEFHLTARQTLGSSLETALYMIVFSDPEVPSEAKTKWVKSFFTRERLPYEDGWTRSKEQLTLAQGLAIANKILNPPAELSD
ncbi:related to chloroperoxidase [Rhynchosporium secalis]|uniref:Related to chloroperoxidase n=1 Tax=Rhynchosporium secalis TaxID=38038 RepID=A0A1E1M467_RHYSE|nr:related to chloroperoxidase [Rhynchosporium secalis]